MKVRLQALLIHGMGNGAHWWAPFIEPLKRCGIEPVSLNLPDLNSNDPHAWVNTVVTACNDTPCVLIGHSLGATVALETARQIQVEGVFLLSMPVFSLSAPSPPVDSTGLCTTALARVGIFMRNAVKKAPPVCNEIVHFVGSNDPYVNINDASTLPYTIEILADCGHEINCERRAISSITDRILHSAPLRMMCDPGKRYTALNTTPHTPATALGLDTIAPSPNRIDIEVTTACQLSCPFCARTRLSPPGTERFMDINTFTRVLEQFPFAEELVFVGLGEPLLHDTINEMVNYASTEKLTVKLVTNGIAANREKLDRLGACGLSEVVFSIDSLDRPKFRKLRGGADLDTVLHNFRHVPKTIVKSIFVTLSQDNIGDLQSIIDLAAEERLPAIGITDLNFSINKEFSLAGADCRDQLIAAIRYAHNRGVLLIGPHMHNTPDVIRAFRHLMVRYPSDICGRSKRHQNCLAPWRSAVIDVNGNLSPCNCSPDVIIAAQELPLSQIWNSREMQLWRHSVMQGTNIHCKCCPRF